MGEREREICRKVFIFERLVFAFSFVLSFIVILMFYFNFAYLLFKLALSSKFKSDKFSDENGARESIHRDNL